MVVLVVLVWCGGADGGVGGVVGWCGVGGGVVVVVVCGDGVVVVVLVWLWWCGTKITLFCHRNRNLSFTS